MNKKTALDLLMLLSALESWSFSISARLPEHTSGELDRLVGELRDEILEEVDENK